MFYYVYILQSIKDNSKYIGSTPRLRGRLEDHNEGKSMSTKAKRPWKLIYFEAYPNKLDALNREKYLKSGYGRRSINTMLKNYFDNN
ncbi:excinuclease ABC subunit C [candidate division WWE3 bacterium CG_4_9_14_3_um_filter_41_6]|uniref:Excinuclease ABC subunit C n=1 Tax=candidate division WWE3 bacterium CG_4_10_14_0_2_um_filter_41_14 TaxID=1975072 RepID=A0A2M7TL10_UNCKA|nr:MAG: excinuclease ABC subunit C [candidate division WWE3 bacterium CG_4_10_14_0_2_um_filter_41_14]PJA39530.1 MAG: excinuclease ABC subunit C [candidate division WWE3 bacterium CG_4_9_14_3_um_filter_41_6]